MSVSAYRKTIRETEDPRQIELRLMRKVTSDLLRIDVADKRRWTHEDVKSLSSNMVLWTSLMNDLSEPGNRLPAETRASLISIAMFVSRQTQSMISSKPSGEDLKTLISINQSIAEGLEQSIANSQASLATP